MIPYYIALLRQIETLAIGLTALFIRCLFTGEQIKDIYPDTLKHWGWYYYFFVLFFLIIPYFIMRYNLPHYGIYSILYSINPVICWLGIIISIACSGYVIYKRCSN
jgi:hypothetical protein